MHPRKKLRHGVVRILKGEPCTDADNPFYPIAQIADRVYANRPTPLFELETPCICLWFAEETSDNNRDASRRKYDRDDTLFIEIIVYGDEKCDDSLDDIAEAVEALLLGRRILKDPVTGEEITDDWALTASRLELVGEDTDQVVASLLMTFNAKYPSEATYDTSSHTRFGSFKADLKDPASAKSPASQTVLIASDTVVQPAPPSP